MTSLTMTKLTRETALALMPERAMQPIIWIMIMHTISMTMRAAQRFSPIIRKVTTNTAAGKSHRIVGIE